ncbi:antibiotic biosynthesis monooxygenase family protein [Muricoccus pecuniae]|uniref:Heme-degrading monooxygenase HmoA n=1 Tax=Muricoccus pecuniae TaxID=693023 RepID=A0A840XWH5_9PROT|nr:antibiotic biosynthesis monooxygenase [Roseomonas pecuniae]MBB5692865.1 heme-degrading monooxygenase HmoA [Roseomonas pecuniae]
MYVEIETARLAGPVDEVVQRVRDHVVPLLQGRPGFKGYCAFASEAGDAFHSIGIFESRESAEEAMARLREWAGEGMRGLVEGAETISGEAVFHDVEAPKEQQRDRHRPLFAVIRTYHGLPGQTETMHSIVSKKTLPAIEGAEGFRGFYSFRDEAEPDRAVSVTLFDTREDALRTHDAVLAIMRERLGDMAYDLPEMVAGETAVLATGE